MTFAARSAPGALRALHYRVDLLLPLGRRVVGNLPRFLGVGLELGELVLRLLQPLVGRVIAALAGAFEFLTGLLGVGLRLPLDRVESALKTLGRRIDPRGRALHPIEARLPLGRSATRGCSGDIGIQAGDALALSLDLGIPVSRARLQVAGSAGSRAAFAGRMPTSPPASQVCLIWASSSATRASAAFCASACD